MKNILMVVLQLTRLAGLGDFSIYEEDLLLDDITSSYSTPTKVSQTVKAIDFASAMGSLSSHGLQGRDTNSASKAATKPLDIGKTLSAAGETDLSIAAIGPSQ
ncbi:ribonuclease P [Sarracenia purpurea var. burkii]